MLVNVLHELLHVAIVVLVLDGDGDTLCLWHISTSDMLVVKYFTTMLIFSCEPYLLFVLFL